jgi:hypothetical protein
MIFWLFIYSTGQHLFLPLQPDIGMELDGGKGPGRRLGQINAIAGIAAIVGSAIVFAGFKFFKMNFKFAFMLCAAGFIVAAILFFCMSSKPSKVEWKDKIKLKKEYLPYYWLTVLYGMRKQIFLTFAPWVIVFIFNKKTSVLAFLFTIGRLVGVVYAPWLGRLIDKIGERKILALESLILIPVCLAYGFSKFFFGIKTAFFIVAASFVIDQLLMSVGMARATFS